MILITRNNITVDAILFTCHIENQTTMNYISYFSHHTPLLTDVNINKHNKFNFDSTKIMFPKYP